VITIWLAAGILGKAGEAITVPALPGGGGRSKPRRRRFILLDEIIEAATEAQEAVQGALDEPTKANKAEAIRAVHRLDEVSPDFQIPAPMLDFTASARARAPLVAASAAIKRQREEALRTQRQRRSKQGIILLLLAA
jgi:hypothetical protein